MHNHTNMQINCIDRIVSRATESFKLISAEDLRAISRLLLQVPSETYSNDSISMSWLQISSSHIVPVVYPTALNDQLKILYNERFVREKLFTTNCYVTVM